MRNLLFLFSALACVQFVISQESSIVSNLENLVLDVGQVFNPTSTVVNSDGSQGDCARLIYYIKKGVSSSAKSISVDRTSGTLTAREPGLHQVVAVCLDSKGKRLTETFEVSVNYPKIKELKLSVDNKNIYVGSYISLAYEIIDEFDNKRIIDSWNYDEGYRYLTEVDVSMSSNNEKVLIDESNNILAQEEGSSLITVSFDGVQSEIELEIQKNPVNKLVLKSDESNVRSGDVINFTAVAYDKRGNTLDDITVDFSFTGKSFDKSNSASGLILEDGRFVGDVPGKYSVSARVGNVSASKITNVFPRNVKQQITNVGSGLVNDKHTSDFWIFEGVDGGDYAVTGT